MFNFDDILTRCSVMQKRREENYNLSNSYYGVFYKVLKYIVLKLDFLFLEMHIKIKVIYIRISELEGVLSELEGLLSEETKA